MTYLTIDKIIFLKIIFWQKQHSLQNFSNNTEEICNICIVIVFAVSNFRVLYNEVIVERGSRWHSCCWRTDITMHVIARKYFSKNLESMLHHYNEYNFIKPKSLISVYKTKKIIYKTTTYAPESFRVISTSAIIVSINNFSNDVIVKWKLWLLCQKLWLLSLGSLHIYIFWLLQFKDLYLWFIYKM